MHFAAVFFESYRKRLFLRRERNYMPNFIFISPAFPGNYENFCVALRANGVNVLGIGDTPYDCLSPRLNCLLYTSTVISNEYFLKQYRILHRAIDDTAAGNQTILYIGSCIIFCRRKILNLGINIRVIVQKMLSHICFQEIHVGLVICCLLYTSRCV